MIVTAGEDGCINVLNVAHRKPVRTIGILIFVVRLLAPFFSQKKSSTIVICLSLD
jgi:hypothetical protein